MDQQQQAESNNNKNSPSSNEPNKNGNNDNNYFFERTTTAGPRGPLSAVTSALACIATGAFCVLVLSISWLLLPLGAAAVGICLCLVCCCGNGQISSATAIDRGDGRVDMFAYKSDPTTNTTTQWHYSGQKYAEGGGTPMCAIANRDTKSTVVIEEIMEEDNEGSSSNIV
mmetsp:Transcript_29708/g.45922  ORF Transcript_29708/g.45922 Transcript_29708/m.45922 type:complete len:170 (+) Transcript_29708:79-588(+)